MAEPILRLKDGAVLEFEDTHFEGGGGCETCGYGGECDTDLIVTTTAGMYEIAGVNGSKALTFVMHNLADIPSWTLDEFETRLTSYLHGDSQ